jgi:hypothetical protein
MRYDTCGDWEVVDDVLDITAARGSDPRYAISVALHEFIESTLCLQAGITTEDVDNFDIHGPGALIDDPGRDIRAPYHKQHIFAEAMEHNFANHLGINWAQYDKEITETTYGNETACS